ncbi:MAG: hypothetical protein E6J32_08300 [Chloroflexi bacterium]|nr:MAG: hypothetical protein E6J32_08300 [Chloroflexota bacterium]
MAAPNDDAAVWRGDSLVAATTDTMVEGVDFRLEWPGLTFRLLGRRLMSINLSDLAAMGADPGHALISLCLPGSLVLQDVTGLYRGISERARQYGCTIAGGDLSGTDGPMVLTAALYGTLPTGRRPLRRSGARAGWGLGVTGVLGRAAAGLGLLLAGKSPRTAAERHIESLPLRRGLKREQWPLAVSDSEDFELICAAPQGRLLTAQQALKRLKLPLTVVGEIDARPGIRIKHGGRVERLRTGGYEHFR